MRQRLILSLALCTAATLTGCSGKTNSAPVNIHRDDGKLATQDPNTFRLPAERIGSRGADRVIDSQTLPTRDNGTIPSGGGESAIPTPTPTPDVEPEQESEPEKTASGQVLGKVSTYCSDSLATYTDTSLPAVSNIKFHFFDQKRTNFLAYTVWDKNTDAAPLKNYLKQKKAIFPAEFTGIADGIYDVLICNQAEPYCDFVEAFTSFSLYNSIVLGQAYGVVGIVHLHIAAAKITSYDKAWFLYPSATTDVTCNRN